MFKRIILFVLSLGIVNPIVSLNVFANRIDNAYTVEHVNTIGEVGGYLSENTSAIHKLYKERKFVNTNNGHAFAAERGNNLIDRIKGVSANVVGDDNAKNGADRKIINRDGSITWVQDKYYSSAKLSVESAFDEVTGEYRYYSEDINKIRTPMKLEVPSDQYDDAIKLMKSKIENGKVPGITDPDKASEIIKKGHLSYKQAKNIAKSGTVESLSYDAISGAVISVCSAGITFAIDYACCVMNGIDSEVALKNACLNGLKTGSVVFATYVISSQLAKTGITKAFVPTAEAITKTLGDDVCRAILNKAGITAGDTVAAASKIIANELLIDGVLIVVLTGIDIAELFRGRISKEELLKNLTVTVISTAAGTLGGLAVSGLIAPGISSKIIAIVAAVLSGTMSSIAAEKIIGEYYESDAEEMYAIISGEFLSLSQEYLINQDEGDVITDKLKNRLVGDTLKDMYESKNRNEFARNLLDPIFREQVNQRTVIKNPTESQIRTATKEALRGIVFVH